MQSRFNLVHLARGTLADNTVACGILTYRKLNYFECCSAKPIYVCTAHSSVHTSMPCHTFTWTSQHSVPKACVCLTSKTVQLAVAYNLSCHKYSDYLRFQCTQIWKLHSIQYFISMHVHYQLTDSTTVQKEKYHCWCKYFSVFFCIIKYLTISQQLLSREHATMMKLINANKHFLILCLDNADLTEHIFMYNATITEICHKST